MLPGTVMASAGGQRVLNVVSLLLLLTSGVTSETHLKSSNLSPSPAIRQTSLNPPTSMEPFITTAIIPANMMMICSKSVYMTAFIPPYKKHVSH
ncbi:hypothetical protein EB796_023414 [Bugula neritina]|uniref:Uncharacterized protein n=1 Tax=Bugula neritina TaxID=10212 RepID=A0A7J7IY17_BUGNE|nr:hypothetical protein EB796_023414 [Bugula neritina]